MDPPRPLPPLLRALPAPPRCPTPSSSSLPAQRSGSAANPLRSLAACSARRCISARAACGDHWSSPPPPPLASPRPARSPRPAALLPAEAGGWRAARGGRAGCRSRMRRRRISKPAPCLFRYLPRAPTARRESTLRPQESGKKPAHPPRRSARPSPEPEPDGRAADVKGVPQPRGQEGLRAVRQQLGAGGKAHERGRACPHLRASAPARKNASPQRGRKRWPICLRACGRRWPQADGCPSTRLRDELDALHVARHAARRRQVCQHALLEPPVEQARANPAPPGTPKGEHRTALLAAGARPRRLSARRRATVQARGGALTPGAPALVRLQHGGQQVRHAAARARRHVHHLHTPRHLHALLLRPHARSTQRRTQHALACSNHPSGSPMGKHTREGTSPPPCPPRLRGHPLPNHGSLHRITVPSPSGWRNKGPRSPAHSPASPPAC